MKLISFRTTTYKSITDTGEIETGQVTRTIGQNEAGKTATLESLHKINPINGTRFIPLEDYPRMSMSRYKKKVHPTNPATAITAKFQLSEAEIKMIEEQFGVGVISSDIVEVYVKYEQEDYFFILKVDEKAFMNDLIKKFSPFDEIKEKIKGCKTIKQLKSLIEEDDQLSDFGTKTKSTFEQIEKSLAHSCWKLLTLPKFFYFDEYATLPDRVPLNQLKAFRESNNCAEELRAPYRTALALLDLAGTEIEELVNPENYERGKADLEAASNQITTQLRKYWSTNANLKIEIDVDHKSEPNNPLLRVRVQNLRYGVSVPYHKRSKGFIWFFSFLVAFSEYEDKTDTILLLDEPGLNLGAVAQRDLLRYFREELEPNHQLIYTTHSPFMIEPSDLQSVRIVEDDPELGTIVSNDPLKHTKETLFPLQAALGYEIAQTLFVSPNNLLVEGPSDLIYMKTGSEILRGLGRVSLSNLYSIVPCGSLDKIASFVALLGGNGLRVTVFKDVADGDRQKLQAIMASKLLLKSDIISVGSVLDVKNADIEDMFTPEKYLQLVNKAYSSHLGGASIRLEDLESKNPRIVKRLELYFEKNGINNGSFSHYLPAYYLMTNPEEAESLFDKTAQDNFENAFTQLNARLEVDRMNPGLPKDFLANQIQNSPSPQL